ncbi:exonuclease V [Cubamyces lactineus]|nr:exonuclease V [Cubamyces lactineus]
MPDTDEYDEYYSPIDPEELVNIEAAALAAYALRESTAKFGQATSIATTASTEDETESQTSQQLQLVPPSPSSDEFGSYDFSEFTGEDFDFIDALAVARTPTMSPSPISPLPAMPTRGQRPSRSSISRRGGWIGGPQVEIAFERAVRADSHRLVKGSKSRTTPFQQFRRWNKVLSVTDLVGPSWCEVQFDYGLRQQRYKKLEDRPTAFVTAEGKTINVVQDVAAKNDRTVTRGKSVHKVLEREMQPEQVAVEITTQEERWALRLINMLAGLQTLAELGYCREMPVFGIVHGQVVTGIIDEIARRPVTKDESIERQASQVGTSSPNKRAAPHSTPSTPSKSSAKRSKHDPPSDQRSITAFFSPSKHHTSPSTSLPRYTLHLSDTKTRIRPSLPPDEDTYASRLQLMLYHRLLSDLLASATPTVPTSVSAALSFAEIWDRVGVDSSRRFSDGFLVQSGLAASTMDADAHVNLSGIECLNDLVAAFKHTIEALGVSKVDRTLTLVYRKQPERRRATRTHHEETSTPSEQLAAAIQASVSDMEGGTGGDDDLARAIYESLKDSLKSNATKVNHDSRVLEQPFGASISDTPGSSSLAGELYGGLTSSMPSTRVQHALEEDPTDPQVAWALRESLYSRPDDPKRATSNEHVYVSAISDIKDDAITPTTAATKAEETMTGTTERFAEQTQPQDDTKTAPPSPSHSDGLAEVDESMTVAELDVEARILGTKEFELDDVLLDEYLTRVLAWWHGARPPEGVSVELTRRCTTCEYREGCEWREKKAQEALRRYHREEPTDSEPVAAWS